MKQILIEVFERLLTDPLNKRICNIGLAVSAVLFFGNLIIHYLIQNS